MKQFIDLSHSFENNMPGFRLKDKSGKYFYYTAKIRPFLTHEQSAPMFDNKCSFEVTEVSFQTSIGTYLDSPFHRYPEGRDISEIEIGELVLQGIVIDARGYKKKDVIGPEILPQNIKLKDKAVLINFGWDKYWGKEQYYSFPNISGEFVEYLVASGIKLIGVDTLNIDNLNDIYRTAHTTFLKKDIFIIENLTGLEKLYNKEFRIFAVPIKGKKVAAMPIRAFAEIN